MRNVRISYLIPSLLSIMLLCCGCSSANPDAAQSAEIETGTSNREQVQFPEEEQAKINSDIRQNAEKGVRDFQKNAAFVYTEKLESDKLTASYQFQTDDTQKNAALILESVGWIGLCGFVDDYNSINTLEVRWLDQNADPIAAQTYTRNTENQFQAVGDYHWENTDYEAICRKSLNTAS